MNKLIFCGATMLQAVAAVSASGDDFLSIADRRDMVVDQVNNVLYVSTTSSRVERYDIATGTRLAAWSVPDTSFNGLDISRDGSRLFVANGSTSNGTGSIEMFDTATGARTTSSYALTDSERAAWDVAVTSAGYAIFTADRSGSGSVPYRRLDAQTGEVLGIMSSIRQRTQMYSSADGNYVLFATGNVAPSSVSLWDAVNEEFISSASRPGYNDFKALAVSRDGGYIAMGQFNNIELFDTMLEPIANISGGTGGVGFSPIADILFFGNQNANEIVAFDLATFTEIDRYAVPDMLGSGVPFGSGIMDFSQDGRTLFVTTLNGVARIDNVVPSSGSLWMVGAAGLVLCRRRR